MLDEIIEYEQYTKPFFNAADNASPPSFSELAGEMKAYYAARWSGGNTEGLTSPDARNSCFRLNYRNLTHDFAGPNRAMTVIARMFLFDPPGRKLFEDGADRIAGTREVLKAWCGFAHTPPRGLTAEGRARYGDLVNWLPSYALCLMLREYGEEADGYRASILSLPGRIENYNEKTEKKSPEELAADLAEARLRFGRLEPGFFTAAETVFACLKKGAVNAADAAVCCQRILYSEEAVKGADTLCRRWQDYYDDVEALSGWAAACRADGLMSVPDLRKASAVCERLRSGDSPQRLKGEVLGLLELLGVVKKVRKICGDRSASADSVEKTKRNLIKWTEDAAKYIPAEDGLTKKQEEIRGKMERAKSSRTLRSQTEAFLDLLTPVRTLKDAEKKIKDARNAVRKEIVGFPLAEPEAASLNCARDQVEKAQKTLREKLAGWRPEQGTHQLFDHLSPVAHSVRARKLYTEVLRYLLARESAFEQPLFSKKLVASESLDTNDVKSITYSRLIADARDLGPLKRYRVLSNWHERGEESGSSVFTDHISRRTARRGDSPLSGDALDSVCRLIFAYMLSQHQNDASRLPHDQENHTFTVVVKPDVANWCKGNPKLSSEDLSQFYYHKKTGQRPQAYENVPLFCTRVVGGNVLKLRVEPQLFKDWGLRLEEVCGTDSELLAAGGPKRGGVAAYEDQGSGSTFREVVLSDGC